METASEIRAEHVLLAAAIILATGSVLGYFAHRLRVPDIVLFLIAGIVLGPELLGVLNIPATSTLFGAIIIFAANLFFIRSRNSCRGDADTLWTNEIPVGKPLVHKEDRSRMRVRVLLAVSAATLTGLTTMVGATANAAPSQTGQLRSAKVCAAPSAGLHSA